IAIRPGTDLFLLLAMLRRVIATEAYDRDFVARHCSGFETLAAAVSEVDPDQVAVITDVSRNVIDRVADEFAAARAAFATTRVGVQTSRNTTLTEWAVQCLNAVTGNIDRPGSVYFN